MTFEERRALKLAVNARRREGAGADRCDWCGGPKPPRNIRYCGKVCTARGAGRARTDKLSETLTAEERAVAVQRRTEERRRVWRENYYRWKKRTGEEQRREIWRRRYHARKELSRLTPSSHGGTIERCA